MRMEKLQSFVNCHIKNFRDIFTFIGDIQSLCVVSLAMANITGNPDIAHKLHFNF